jgi:hypothetical protein
MACLLKVFSSEGGTCMINERICAAAMIVMQLAACTDDGNFKRMLSAEYAEEKKRLRVLI